MFNKDFFNKHQKTLLWFLNTPGIRVLFRWMFRIKKYDCPTNVKINRIEPNAYWFGAKLIEDKVEVTADFRTHNKFAKRLYYGFKPLWYTFHAWDMVINHLYPKWNLGFDTLTAYPDPDPETSTVDGYIFSNPPGDVSWATVISSAGTIAADDNTVVVLGYASATTTTDMWNQIARGFTLFDTSSIGSSATISAATLSFWGSSKDNGVGDTNAHVVSSSPASNTAIATTDWNTHGSTSFGSIAISSFSTGAYNDITLNASGISAISKTGITKFGETLEWVLNASFTGSWASGGITRAYAAAAETAGTSNDPKLVVTYTIGGATNLLTLLGVG